MIDVHAHLCFPDFDRDVEEVIARARKELSGIIVSSARYDEGVKALELCRRHRGFLFPSLGYHPVDGTDPEGVMRLIREHSREIVAVGEAGMDYHHEKEPGKREEQAGMFKGFIGLASEFGKPLVIHSWDAERECFELVKGSGLACIFHCFSGKKEIAHEIVQVPDFYISVSTQVLFNKALRKVAKAMPLQRLLLETDAPFLSPERGERNMPWNIIRSAEKIADLRGIDASEVLNSARENAVRAFGLRLSV
jgi:TatD DNase family protein